MEYTTGIQIIKMETIELYYIIPILERVVGRMFFKKALLATIIICLAILPISVQGWAGWSGLQNEERNISEKRTVSIDDLMAYAGFQREYLNINTWARLEEDCASIRVLESLADKALEFFGITGDYDHIINQGKNIKQVNVRGVNEKNQVVSIICHSVDTSGSKNGGWESYIVVDIVDRFQKAGESGAKSRMEAFFNAIGLNARITTTLVGSIKGQLKREDMEDICSDLFACIQADKAEGIIDEEFISISGYSPFIDECITSGGSNVNIQAAMRYNSYKDKTYLWIGIPIISIEY
ncbi:MAG: YwmB family TATA-box binding protein [Clostridiales bacterium]|jgi:hypothetical protein|nr:YwmB family TATA-box binding protein [Clostridiales bacterium]